MLENNNEKADMKNIEKKSAHMRKMQISIEFLCMQHGCVVTGLYCVCIISLAINLTLSPPYLSEETLNHIGQALNDGSLIPLSHDLSE